MEKLYSKEINCFWCKKWCLIHFFSDLFQWKNYMFWFLIPLIPKLLHIQNYSEICSSFMKENNYTAFSLFLQSLSVSVSGNKWQQLVSTGLNIVFLFIYSLNLQYVKKNCSGSTNYYYQSLEHYFSYFLIKN